MVATLNLRLGTRSRTFLILFSLGALVRLVLAMTALVSNDNLVYGAVIDAARSHDALYQSSTFAYPPLLGYYFEGVGKFLQLLGQPTFVRAESLLMYVVPDLTSADVTTPLATFLIKLPALLIDAACCFSIWRVARKLGNDNAACELAVLFWWLNPMTLWSGGIAGAWDGIVPLVILESLLAAFEDRWLHAGALVAFGAFAKIVPAYDLFVLVPIVLRRGPLSLDTVRRLALVAAGGAIVALILLVPIFAWNEVGDMRRALFTRFGDFSPGGLTVLAYLHFNAFAGALAWTQQHRPIFVSAYGALSFLAPFIVAFALGTKRADLRLAITALAALIVSLLLFSPYVQGNYVLWLVPFTTLFAVDVRSLWPWFGFALGAVAAAFAHAVRGSEGYFFPACVWYGICNVGEFGERALHYHYQLGAFGSTLQVELNAGLGEVGGILILTGAILIYLRFSLAIGLFRKVNEGADHNEILPAN